MSLSSPRAPSTFERSPEHRSAPAIRDESRSPAEGRAVVDACSPRAARAFTVRLGVFGLSSDETRAGHPSKASAIEMGPEHVPRGVPIPDHPLRSLPRKELETTRALPRLIVSSGGTPLTLSRGECQSNLSGTGKDVQRRPRAPSRSLVKGPLPRPAGVRDTSCRRLAVSRDGALDVPFNRPRAAMHDFPRRKTRFAAPEVPFVRGRSRRSGEEESEPSCPRRLCFRADHTLLTAGNRATAR